MKTNEDPASAATPTELLLIAVGSCMASDVVNILRKKRQKFTDYKIEVTGEHREDFHDFQIHQPSSYPRCESLSERAVKQAIELSYSKYCSVAATLRPAADVVVTYEIVPAAVTA